MHVREIIIQELPDVQVGGNINTLMQQVMSMRSPELLARMPEVEAMKYEDRVALVQRGHDNINQIIKSWDKFGDLLEAQGWTRQEVKRKAKALKNAREKLVMGLRLTDRKKIPAPFHDKADQAFNVLAAWFLMDAGYLENVLRGPQLTRAAIASGEIDIRGSDGDRAGGAREDAVDDVEMTGPDMAETEMAGPSDARDDGEDLVDQVEREGGSHYRA